ncbi:SDR family NAD(P)-dependent oxidoreductase [Desulfofundulus thermosubterraneus]|uniref:2-deoxy-D-gluconate 3-dehydrogenase n=1 Tax=Desulfofundulus thermosubterraneus DSM 16057 TaxID=1121432 RepID=A0A1M6CGU1_9FIRM|nr:glucose 1-dehydrogenase [Desulfofundulus thermosubterraneus]SHI60250.1 2-deoxy-D-gluconate 3-dehydrogenase [Desulfofundulus thermosubterraneus DSM 16057]
MNLPTFSLNGKVALVTGSTKGIGYGIALALAQSGADLVIVSRNQADCDRVADEIRGMGRRAIGVATDVTQNDQVQKLVERTVAEYGRIDILVNNAGTAITKRAEDLMEADFDRVVALDQRAVFFVAQAVGRQMIKQGGGRIINVASILGLVGERQVLPYCVAKGGVIQMTRALALEWAKYNINVNALCPGYVITPMNEADLKNEKIYNHLIKNIPMRRLGQVEDMVGAVVFLASDAASYMTGQCLVIDGGWTAQ